MIYKAGEEEGVRRIGGGGGGGKTPLFVLYKEVPPLANSRLGFSELELPLRVRMRNRISETAILFAKNSISDTGLGSRLLHCPGSPQILRIEHCIEMMARFLLQVSPITNALNIRPCA